MIWNNKVHEQNKENRGGKWEICTLPGSSSANSRAGGGITEKTEEIKLAHSMGIKLGPVMGWWGIVFLCECKWGFGFALGSRVVVVVYMLPR